MSICRLEQCTSIFQKRRCVQSTTKKDVLNQILFCRKLIDKIYRDPTYVILRIKLFHLKTYLH